MDNKCVIYALNYSNDTSFYHSALLSSSSSSSPSSLGMVFADMGSLSINPNYGVASSASSSQESCIYKTPEFENGSRENGGFPFVNNCISRSLKISKNGGDVCEDKGSDWSDEFGENNGTIDLNVGLDEEKTDMNTLFSVEETENGPQKLCARGHWRPAEDTKLKELVALYGPQNWNLIAEKLEGRSGKSCRLRWFNQLDPRINKRSFTEEEEERLMAAHRLYGNKWAMIARLFPGRTDNAVKNHWHVIMARKYREQSSAYRRRKLGSSAYKRMDTDSNFVCNTGINSESTSVQPYCSPVNFSNGVLSNLSHCSLTTLEGAKSHEMMAIISQNRSWDRPINESNISYFYPHHHHHPPLMTAAIEQQQSQYYQSYPSTFSDSTASTPQVSVTDQPTSSVTENIMACQFESIAPPFIDFLGVGAT